ncbi:serine/threonine-protein kinase Pkn6 [Cystobacter fuscus DSM 2262]|uniref:Serine/threonine-protein kinase Pkn6 n=1 Tax=Cystobacter fuscus (strain ATCC 25194 / DSM 2262 / NBRC 100088 / M29) TaxID=1242864 RepID=S9R504_CYSF2|nr:serine/threonine-protein kinase [Cystobacter fuscus]EPX64008.1 serine/threonine-protein kinase Pkn6 [Cystobacter fuscus DSM 2262]
MTRQVGKYQLIRKLAVGDTAEVFLAKAAGPWGFEKTVAVKCILPHLAREPSFVELFLSEARLAARLTHPNIVQIFDFGEADGSSFLAMEYVDGPSLRTLVRRASARRLSLPPVVCARLISQACEALAFAHDFVDPDTGEPLGLIHRDVSPDHLLLSLQGTVKVVDFGITRASGRSHRTRGGIGPGRRAYMAPEQLRARHLDRRVDVYALGVVLQELLTLHEPSSTNPRLREEPVPLVHSPVHSRPEVPESLQRILDRALARERHQRYPDCHALQTELEDFILAEGRTVTTQQVAQLVHRATSGTGLPAQRLSRAVAPRPPRLAPIAPPRESASARALDSTPEWRPLPDGWAESGALTTLSEHPVAPLAVALPVYPPPPALAQTLARTRPPPGAWSWTRQVLVGGLLFVAGGGLLPWKRSTARERVESSVVELPRALSATPPTEPSPRALEQVPRELALGVEEVAAFAEPAAPPPATRERIARSVKSRRPFPAALGRLDVRAHPQAVYAVVSVDGRPSGTTPLDKALELPVGTYTVTLTSPTLAKTVIRRVEVKPGMTTPLTVSFLQEE